MAHIIDHEFYRDSWGTPEMRDVFSETRRFQRWLDIEATLAEVQADLGIIPKAAAQEIRSKARFELFDPDRIRTELKSAGHTLMPVLYVLESLCEGGHGEWIHFGATTQDIQDTGTALEVRDAWAIILRDLKKLELICLDKARQYAELPMVGRTHNQQGLPITLGLKFASWAAELRRNIERMKDLPERCFFVMLHGGVGTMAGFGDQAMKTAKEVAKRLELFYPPTCWANARDGIAEFQTVISICAGTLGRIANEIYQLARTEIGELNEPIPRSVVGSSTMPHKRNPARAEFSVAMVRIVQANTQLALQGMLIAHERDGTLWRLDWHSLPESSVLLARVLANMIAIVGDIHVDEQRIKENLELLGGALLSEAVMFRLGEKVGKQTAHHLLHAALMEGAERGISFRDAVSMHPKVRAALSAEELNAALDYSRYLGTSAEQVRDVIAESERRRATDPA